MQKEEQTMSSFYTKMQEDQAFQEKVYAGTGEEARAFIKAEGFEVGDAEAFVRKVQDDADLSDKLAELESLKDKMNLVMESGYYFTKEELEAAQEKVAEEEFDTLAGGINWKCLLDGHCGATCEKEVWDRDSACKGYFKCTWG